MTHSAHDEVDDALIELHLLQTLLNPDATFGRSEREALSRLLLQHLKTIEHGVAALEQTMGCE